MSNLTSRSSMDLSSDHLVDLSPLGDETEFAKLITDMVTDQAPRLFAVVIEYGDRLDAQLAAWGLAFDEHAYVVTIDGKNQYVVTEPESALRYIRDAAHTTPRLVWVTPKLEDA
jgi:hypothetical protein